MTKKYAKRKPPVHKIRAKDARAIGMTWCGFIAFSPQFDRVATRWADVTCPACIKVGDPAERRWSRQRT